MKNSPPGANLLSQLSLSLGVASIALVFGVGLCALVGARQGLKN